MSSPRVAPEEPPFDAPPTIPVIETNDSELEPPTEQASSGSELSKEHLYPPGLEPSQEKHAFALSDVVNEEDKSFEPWPLELAGVDINIAPDGTYIETSSGPAARELKRRYDQRYGVSVNVRSPYAITAFVNQHGKQMFRVGHRELSAPAASSAEVAAEVEDRIIQSKTSNEVSQSPPRTRRRSRMSMHTLFPPNVFATHRPTTTAPPINSAPKKLRKARSIPDMASIGGSEVNEHGELVISPPSVPTHNGRAHSQSVTAMDMPRFSQSSRISLHHRRGDIFADVMNSFPPLTSVSSRSFLSGTPSLVHADDSNESRPIIAHPFGVGVSFETPLKKPPPSYLDQLPAPRHVRLMQSFESGLTARQDDPRVSTPEAEEHRPPSAIRVRTSFLAETQSRPSSTYEPPAEASQLSEYASTVFDVLQTYRGLPDLDKLCSDPEATTVKISLSSETSAVPRDDPRFVIWGELSQDHDADESAISDIGSSMSKRRSSKASRTTHSEASSHSPTRPVRILVAATIERWIAQLTSDLNYDELLDFFLTYRTYISGVDLCHLLISRFQWALQQPKNSQDETVRRIVRVRTFVAIRYWLLTFFNVDFIPNRELRLLMSNWLNTLIHDPLLKQHSDGLGIVRRLVKVAKDCKQAHIRPDATGDKDRRKSASVSKSAKTKTHVLGQKFAEAVLKDDEDSDVDLDFLPDEATSEDSPLSVKDGANAHLAAGHVGAIGPSRPASLPISSFNILQRIDQTTGTTSTDPEAIHVPVPLPMQNSSLSRAFVKTIGRLGRLKRVLNSRSSARNSLNPCTGVSAFDLELSVSRDLLAVNGGVEQYLKNMEPLSNRKQAPPPLTLPQTSPRPSASVGPSGLRSVSSMSLSQAPSPTNRPSPPGLAQPSALLSAQQPITPTTPTPTHHYTHDQPLDETSAPSPDKSIPSEAPPTYEDRFSPSLPTPPPEEPQQAYSDTNSSFLDNPSERTHVNASSHTLLVGPSSSSSHRAESIRSFASSTGSLGEVLDGTGTVQPLFARSSEAFHQPFHNEHFDIVSLDDFDMSDTSSEVHASGPLAPPGLRREPRRLPTRKDFEFLPRRSVVSSMGIISRASVLSGPPSSATSSVSVTGEEAPQAYQAGPIQQWQMNALLDSLSVDEEDGDVEAALKRLEGQINPQKVQEKRSKVDVWVRTIQARQAAGDFKPNEESRFPMDSDEEDEDSEDDNDDEDEHESVSQHDFTLYPPGLERSASGDGSELSDGAGLPHTPQQSLGVPPVSSSSSSEVGSTARSEDAKPAVEDAVPIEILNSRVSTILPLPVSEAPPPIPSNPAKFSKHETLRVHQSFILSYRAVTLAEQFSMIDRELFMGVKFEELVTDEWMATEEVNVYDWSQYLKDRATWKAEHRNGEKTTALAALRARFNLMANFVISEVVLTPPNQRNMVVAKFIRIAWKSYELSNFNTLVAIIAALQDDRVAQAMRRPGWKIGHFESRVYRNLKVFVSGINDFALIRSAVEAIVESKPKEANSRAPSIASGSGVENQGKGKAAAESRPNVPTACIPFIGIYLAQLHRLKRLPDLIDPTSPNETVGMNASSGDFDPPAHPEVFEALAPLPPTMRLEPLVNVHKQRKIAAVIKSLVASQHVASRVNFEVDKKLFQRCLRVRALDPEVLQRALAVYD